MEKGDKVKIYQKPLTEEDFEGKAILIKHLSDASYGNIFVENWKVRFENGDEVLRAIKNE